LASKIKKAWKAESDDDVAAAAAANDDDDVDDAATNIADSSSPISAALKRARVLFGSGKFLSFIPLHSTVALPFSFHCFATALLYPIAPVTPDPLFFFFAFLTDGSTSFVSV
jgi:hypothetical protein